MQSIFVTEGIDLWLYPYGCIPFLFNEQRAGGIIDLVKNCVSRHDIGAKLHCRDLTSYFEQLAANATRNRPTEAKETHSTGPCIAASAPHIAASYAKKANADSGGGSGRADEEDQVEKSLVIDGDEIRSRAEGIDGDATSPLHGEISEIFAEPSAEGGEGTLEAGRMDVRENGSPKMRRDAQTHIHTYTSTEEEPVGAYDETVMHELRENFSKSLAGYSLLSYLLQVKDRHNANILVTRNGCLVHVDFGFILDSYPHLERSIAKRAHFKFTSEMLVLLTANGTKNEYYERLKQRIVDGFIALRRHRSVLVDLLLSYADLPCYGRQTIHRFK